MIDFMGKIKKILGDNIRTLRVSKGWTQVYLADRLQITAPFLAQIESGKRGTSLELIESTAEIFEIPIASLFLEQMPNRSETKNQMRNMELKNAEKQLLESISESISITFDRLMEK